MPKRDEFGRFIAGTSGNPNGRPPKAREERFLEITLNACTFKDWEDIVKKAVYQAKHGNSTARKWLSDFLIGPPQQRVDVTTKDESLNDSGVLTDAQRAALLAALIEGAEGDAAGSGADE
jgi:hypothetical protein